MELKNNEDAIQNDNKALETCQTELAHAKEHLLYLTADFDNYRRRTEKEKIQWSQFAQEAILKDLIALVDDFDRSAGELSDKAGFELIYKSCKKMLQKYGVEEITQITTFDPHLHEAIMSVQTEEKESGAIVQVLQKGYMFKGTILRPAQVSVVQ